MATRIETLASILRDAPGRVFIQAHDVPDPDAIASAFGLRSLLSRFGVESAIVYEREFEKIDAQRMVELLGIELSIASSVPTIGPDDWAVIVDGQRGNANMVDLPCLEVAAIDHHPLRDDAAYRYADIRPEIGSCAAMIAEYYVEAGQTPSGLVATALTYGIFVDTDNLTRGVSDLDARMFYALRAWTDADLIRKLRGSQITLRDLAMYAEALGKVETRGRLAFLGLRDADDSLIGAANDLVLSVDEVDVSLAYSLRGDGIKLSTRSLVDGVRADGLAEAVVEGLGFAGGHAHMGGGFIPAAAFPPGEPPEAVVKRRAAAYIEGLASDRA
ncbi:MAG TPA: DHH family phosphoesterase [Spirochaetia bacterium]|nr:DHH family phosphoesterase [Spirochaetales bacterium]HRW25446.1 DHH family phosphoesterase [Spirochaetia bacterium]